eukprot:IDg17608t1
MSRIQAALAILAALTVFSTYVVYASPRPINVDDDLLSDQVLERRALLIDFKSVFEKAHRTLKHWFGTSLISTVTREYDSTALFDSVSPLFTVSAYPSATAMKRLHRPFVSMSSIPKLSPLPDLPSASPLPSMSSSSSPISPIDLDSSFFLPSASPLNEALTSMT